MCVANWLARRRHRKHKPRPPVPTPVPVPVPTPVPAPPPPVTITVAWVSTDASVTGAQMQTWIDALNVQVPDIQALWPHVEKCTHVVGNRPGAVLATLKSDIPEAPGALAYHGFDGEVAYIVVGVQTCKRAGVSVSSAMSHEAVEMTVDPSCMLTATAPNGDVWALEDADPVESNSYFVTTPAGVRVEVSDFVGAAFFKMGPGPLDHTGNASAPFSIAPGGYAVINGEAIGADRFLDPDDLPHPPPPQRLA